MKVVLPSVPLALFVSIVIITMTTMTTTTNSLAQVQPQLQPQAQPQQVLALGSDNTVHTLPLKATQAANAQVIPVSNFVIAPDNLVQLKQNGNLAVLTSSIIDKVMVTNAQGVSTELLVLPLGTNLYSLQSLTPGVYTLNVVIGNSAYETMLVILTPTQQPIPPTEVIKQFVVTDVSVSFDDREGGCSNNPGSAGLAFPYQNKSECEHDEYQKCIRDGKIISQKCIELVGAFTDDCDGFANQKECDEWYKNNPPCDVLHHDGTGLCPIPMPRPIPICDSEEAIAGQPCKDEGDFTDCPEGFIDKGFGCEAVEEEEEGEEENTQNCGGEPCTDTEKEDSWLDDEEVVEEETEDDQEVVEESDGDEQEEQTDNEEVSEEVE